MMETLYTIGVYGTTEDNFFGALVDQQIDLFCDIRLRRGVRGSQYIYANSTRLKQKLADIEIDYLHEKSLAPSKAILDEETVADKAKKVARRNRQNLSSGFIKSYQQQVLSTFDYAAFLAQISEYKRVCLFCVECSPSACHRSLVAEYLGEQFNIPLKHLTPCLTS